MIRRAAIALLAAGLAACASRPTSPSPAAAPIVPPAASPPRAPDRRALFLEDALAMLGRPYRYGGDAPSGFDCSGLVYYAARRAGLDLPRTTGAQRKIGAPVARDALRPGDLVFMRFPRKELHVGIMLGRRHFLHAPSSGESVRVDTLAEPAFSRAYLGARRLDFGP